MDKERHLVPDISFDVFERASYGLGCEIQPIVDEKHNKRIRTQHFFSQDKILNTYHSSMLFGLWIPSQTLVISNQKSDLSSIRIGM